MKKKIIALSVALVLVAVAAIGATLSFLTDTQDIKNVYQIGDIDISAKETVMHSSGDGVVYAGLEDINLTNGDPQVEHIYENIQPGDTMKKVVTVTNNGSNPAYVAVAVKMGNHYTFNQNIDDYYENMLENDPDKAAFLLGDKYYVKGDLDATMQNINNAIFPYANLDYVKTTSGFRLYPTDEVKDQAGAINYNDPAIAATLPDKKATLLAVDAVKASSNNGEANGFGAYAENMFKAGDTDVTSSNDAFAVPDFYAVKNDVTGGVNNGGERLWVYYYYVPANTSETLDYTVVCPDFIDNSSLKAFDDMYLNVQVSAIQVTGFDSARDAFLELNKTYPYNAY
ncbi:MAG: hypothetical protein IJB76_04430 [Clostridia bacterium]|nr:hypothetical protein [Clostridia bacterium]